MVRLGRVYSNLMIDMVATNAKLRGRMISILVEATGCSEERLPARADRRRRRSEDRSGVLSSQGADGRKRARPRAFAPTGPGSARSARLTPCPPPDAAR